MKRDRDLEKEEKVERLYVTQEMAEDKEMDEKIRRDLIQAADQAEEEFQKEEALGFAGMKIEEKQKLFDDIIGELKKKGIWEEENEEQKEEDQKAEEKKENPRRDQKENHQKNENQWEEQKKNQQENEKQKKVDITSKQEEQGKTTVTLSLEEQLSPEDREALRLGRELLQTPQKKHSTTMHKILKGMAGAAIVALGVFVLSMSSEANREKMLSVWNSVVSDGLSINVDETSAENTEIFAEQEAYDAIKEKLGFQITKIMYAPHGMSYDNYMIDDNNKRARIYYSYNKEEIISICMYRNNEKTKRNQKFDGEIVDSIKIESEELETTIWSVNNSNTRTYICAFEYDEVHYMICGNIPKEEFEKMVSSIVFI